MKYEIIKTNRLHPPNDLYAPTDYGHIDYHPTLVMLVVALCCTLQSHAPNIMNINDLAPET